MRKHLEKMMEEDHRAGKPLRAAIMTSPNGVPDKWFFEKARALGYKFDDEFKWWSEQCAMVFESKDDPAEYDANQSLAKIEEQGRRRLGNEEFEEAIIEKHGTVEQWRQYVRQTLIDARAKGLVVAQEMLAKQNARRH